MNNGINGTQQGHILVSVVTQKFTTQTKGSGTQPDQLIRRRVEALEIVDQLFRFFGANHQICKDGAVKRFDFGVHDDDDDDDQKAIFDGVKYVYQSRG